MSRRDRVMVAVAAAACVAAVFYRVPHLGTTLFADEVWVAEQVRRGVFIPGGFPLPPAFFYLVVMASRLCGIGEVCLRLVPTIAGTLLGLAPLLMHRRLQPALSPTAAAIWSLLLTFCSPLLFYSTRIKQYTTEALVGTVLLALFIAFLNGRTRLATFLGVAAIAVIGLHTPVFIIAATASTLVFRRERARTLLIGYAALAVLFAGAYFAYMRPRPVAVPTVGDLYQLFRVSGDYYFDGSFSFVTRQTTQWVGLMLNLTRGFSLVALIAIVAWIIRSIAKRDTTQLAIALLGGMPPVLVLAASAFELYPYGEVRLMTFAAPGLFLLVAAAFGSLIDHPAPLERGAARIVGVLMLAMFILSEVRTRPYEKWYIRLPDRAALHAFVREHHRPGMPLLTRGMESAPLRYYVPATAGDLIVIDDHIVDRKPLGHPPEFWTIVLSTDAQRWPPQPGYVPTRAFADEDMTVTIWRSE